MNFKAKTRKQIAQEFGVREKTLRGWLKREQIVLPKGLISPKDQKRIYDRFGLPKKTS